MGGRGGSALPGEWPTPDCNTSTYSNGLMGPNIREKAEQWLTPNVPNGGRSVSPELVASKGMTDAGEKRTVGLESQTRHWATPTSSDNSNRTTQMAPSHGLTHSHVLAGQASSWPTPTTRDNKGGGIAVTRPDGKSRMDMLDWKAESFSPPGLPTSDGPTSFSSSPGSPLPLPLVASASGGTRPDLSTRKRLNPVFVEWLMGWPLFWTNTEPSASSAEATVLWRSALQQRLSCLLSELES